VANLTMMAYLVGGMYMGSVYQMEGLKNTCIVWTVLYAGSKSCEILGRVTEVIWVWIFFISVGLYFAAL